MQVKKTQGTLQEINQKLEQSKEFLKCLKEYRKKIQIISMKEQNTLGNKSNPLGFCKSRIKKGIITPWKQYEN